MKVCKKCGVLKASSEFYRSKRNKDGLRGICKKCWQVQSEKIYKSHLGYSRKRSRKYYWKNREKRRIYYRENKKKKNAYNQTYYLKNREKILAQKRVYSSKNRERIKDYHLKNKEKIRRWNREYWRKRRRVDPVFRINRNTSGAIRRALKGKKAGRHWEDLVGYTLKDLMEHLESKFESWMSWSNYGSYWHIDHRKPQSLFYFTCSEDPEFKKCWELENLQPLEAKKNIEKGNRYEESERQQYMEALGE